MGCDNDIDMLHIITDKNCVTIGIIAMATTRTAIIFTATTTLTSITIVMKRSKSHFYTLYACNDNFDDNSANESAYN